MKATTFNVSFYCRNSKANSKGLSPIEITIIINGERTIITLPRKENPKEFKAAVASKRSNPIKDYLEATRKRLNEITTELMERGEPLTAATLKEYYMYGGARHYSIETLFSEYIAILNSRVDVDLTPRSFMKYVHAKERFFEIIDKDKPVSAITSAVITEYLSSLRKVFNSTTANEYAQRVKTIIKYGQSKGYIRTNPFVGIHIRKDKKTDILFLTVEELNMIRDTDFKNAAINRVRDLFVFQAASGMSYCDMVAITKEDILFNESGQPYIHKRRAKTNIYFTSVILKDGFDVLKKYDYKLPIISNNKYNAYLKFIRDICGIEKPLHTHIARHSYATRCINEGIRIEVVAKLLGHSTTRQTSHYARLLQKSIVGEVQEAFSKAKDNGE